MTDEKVPEKVKKVIQQRVRCKVEGCNRRCLVKSFLVNSGMKCKRCLIGIESVTERRRQKGEGITPTISMSERRFFVERNFNRISASLSPEESAMCKTIFSLQTRGGAYQQSTTRVMSEDLVQQCVGYGVSIFKEKKNLVEAIITPPPPPVVVEDDMVQEDVIDHPKRFQIQLANVTRNTPLVEEEVHIEMEQMPASLVEFIRSTSNVLVRCNPLIQSLKWKFLISESGCHQQQFHYDNNALVLARTGGLKRNPTGEDIPTSMIIALEDDLKSPTRLNFLQKRGSESSSSIIEKKIQVKQGHCVIFRGDKLHSGAAYSCFNIRLFVGIGTFEFPYVHENKVNMLI